MGLEINIKKTEYLAIRDEEATDLEVDENVKIRGKYKFKYLGFTPSKQGTTEEEIKSRLLQNRTGIRQLHSVIWDKNIRKAPKK